MSFEETSPMASYPRDVTHFARILLLSLFLCPIAALRRIAGISTSKRHSQAIFCRTSLQPSIDCADTTTWKQPCPEEI